MASTLGEAGGAEKAPVEAVAGAPGGSQGEPPAEEIYQPALEDSVGFKMLEKMGWSSGKGLGRHLGGILDPVEACNSEKAYGGKGYGLRHASEALRAERKKPEQMESWEREEQTTDWFKGSMSSMWLPAGLLEDQDKNFASSVQHAPATITKYEDAWDDRVVTTLTERGKSHADGDWEDTWDESVRNDLDCSTLNDELFFSCTVVLGSRVRLLQVEPTGEVFQHMLWASDASSLRLAMHNLLQDDKLRVLRPLVRGSDAQVRTVYGILSGSGHGAMNREAERVQGVEAGVRLFGPMWLLCRTSGRYVRDYTLLDYQRDFL